MRVLFNHMIIFVVFFVLFLIFAWIDVVPKMMTIWYIF